MSDQEKAALKVILKAAVDEALPMVISAEEARLPAAYQALAAAIVGALEPALQKALDAAVDKI